MKTMMMMMMMIKSSAQFRTQLATLARDGILLALFTLATTSLAPASAEANGERLARTCAACHGVDGISANAYWPNLRGQMETYVYNQLLAFKSGERKHELMTPIAQSHSDEDLKALASYFASLK